MTGPRRVMQVGGVAQVVSMVETQRERIAELEEANQALQAQLEGALADLEFATRRFAELTDMLREASS